jgi:hypothetical protein
MELANGTFRYLLLLLLLLVVVVGKGAEKAARMAAAAAAAALRGGGSSSSSSSTRRSRRIRSCSHQQRLWKFYGQWRHPVPGVTRRPNGSCRAWWNWRARV